MGLWEGLKFLLTRGDRAFFCFGGLYLRCPELDHKIRTRVLNTLTEAPEGQTYRRWKLKQNSSDSLSILITGMGRLGNSVLQTLNVLSLANALNSGSTFYHRFDAVDNEPIPLQPNLLFSQVPLTWKRSAPQVIWRTYALTSEKPLTPPCAPEMIHVRKALQERLWGERRNDSQQVRDVLTIYLRSGDVFMGSPEPHYGQPPWVFYEKILEFKKWSAVEIVSEDEANPNFRLIANWCSKRKIAITSKGSKLAEAVSAVINASNLVSARGTFVPSLVYLSEGPKTIFQFHDERSPLLCRADVELWRVVDLEGNYASSVLSRNWKNSEEQRALMVNYPRESLSDVRRD